MNLQPEQIQYLQDVLGISSIVMPSGHVPKNFGGTQENPSPLPSSFKLRYGSPTSKLALISLEPCGESEMQLALKIAEATGEKDFCLGEVADGSWQPMSAWGLSCKYVIIFTERDMASELEEPFKSSSLVTHGLRDMTQGTPEQIKKIKGQVWSQIQAFKQQWRVE